MGEITVGNMGDRRDAYQMVYKISIEKLTEIWNPYNINVWVKMKRPVTHGEIAKAISEGSFISPQEPKTEDFGWDTSPREDHISRIAWLVENWSDGYPIEIDFGIPSMGVSFELSDGNHRLAAAIYRENHFINAVCSGAISEMDAYTLKE